MIRKAINGAHCLPRFAWLVLACLLALSEADDVRADSVDGHAQAENIPAAVADLAKNYEASKSFKGHIPPGLTFGQTYAAHFFQGYTSPPGSGSLGPPGREFEVDSYNAGVAYRRDRPAEVDAVMAGFGYHRVEVEGVWSRGYEKNAFAPTDQSGETWWFGSFGCIAWAPRKPDLAILNVEGIRRVRIDGYVSPKGRYGHLGGYEREILSVSVDTLDK